MGAKETTDTETRTGKKSGRAKPRRKIILNTPPGTKSGARPVSASQPRKRNALGGERMTRILPKNLAQSAVAAQFRQVVISKGTNWNISENIGSAWSVGSQNEPNEEDTSRNRRRMVIAIMVATLMLGIFNSSALVNRVRGLQAGPVEDRIINTAEAWHGWMENQKLSGYIDIARAYVADLKDKRWQDLER